jgi:adenylylsulfate reductase subunit A
MRPNPARKCATANCYTASRKPKTIVEDNIDILVAGAGLGGTGAAFEARYWGKDKKIVIAEKANIDRSGAVAQGLYAINCYMGTRFGENNPEDHVRYARIDLMGMVREDLLFDMARHVDSTVHQFEEWGLPIMRDPKTGAYPTSRSWPKPRRSRPTRCSTVSVSPTC